MLSNKKAAPFDGSYVFAESFCFSSFGRRKHNFHQRICQ